jgi:pyrimidine deaminase RibD-like protein
MKYSLKEANFFMQRALDESHKALPFCRPNPPVGCVLVKDGIIVATGYTLEPGKFHAEANAISKINEHSLREYSAFVTLEPCSFVGRTPSCAVTLKDREIGEVYVSILDPHPKNQGAGIKILQDANIPVWVGILESEVEEFLKPYLIKDTNN